MPQSLINSKARLAVELSKLKGFGNPKLDSEQYLMDSDVGADALWNAYFNDDLKDKTVADLGCGTGILGIGALLLGAAKVIFVDSDENVLDVAKNNLSDFIPLGESEFLHQDVNDFSRPVDIIIQNPPFGTKQKHADKDFLLAAFKNAKIIYSFHKSTSENFIRQIAADNGFRITHRYDYKYPLKATFLFHKRRIHRIDVSCWRLENIQKTL